MRDLSDSEADRILAALDWPTPPVPQESGCAVRGLLIVLAVEAVLAVVLAVWVIRS